MGCIDCVEVFILHRQTTTHIPTGFCANVSVSAFVLAYSHRRGVNRDWYREQDWYNRKQLVLVPAPVSDQCEHFYMILDFPFGPCTSHGPVPLQCKYTICVYLDVGEV